MVERNAFTDQQIQDYIDARLSERNRGAVAAYLLVHPRVAADVEAVRRQSEALRALGHEILDEPVPEHLRYSPRSPSTLTARSIGAPAETVLVCALPASSPPHPPCVSCRLGLPQIRSARTCSSRSER